MFFIFILPPIIFSAGYSLRKSLFFQHISLIGFLGVLGTIFTFIVLSACISFINHILFDRVLTMREVMMLSSVLCATDTVTALSLVKVSGSVE
jgi:sodium/hydrogen exchanger 8